MLFGALFTLQLATKPSFPSNVDPKKFKFLKVL